MLHHTALCTTHERTRQSMGQSTGQPALGAEVEAEHSGLLVRRARTILPKRIAAVLIVVRVLSSVIVSAHLFLFDVGLCHGIGVFLIAFSALFVCGGALFLSVRSGLIGRFLAIRIVVFIVVIVGRQTGRQRGLI